jgi:hypothetical protein
MSDKSYKILIHNMYINEGVDEVKVWYKTPGMNDPESISSRPSKDDPPKSSPEIDPKPVELYVAKKGVRRKFEYIRAYVEWKWNDGVKYDRSISLAGNRDASGIATILVIYNKGGQEQLDRSHGSEPHTINVQVGGN